MAAELENPTRAVYRYRAANAGLLQLKPGMHAAEIGAGSGFIARAMSEQVGPAGKIVATELEPKMVAYMNARATKEGLTNFTAIQGPVAGTGLEPGSMDAVAIVNTFSAFEKPAEMLDAIAAALKPAGTLVVVDFPREGQGAAAAGMDADDVIRMAEAAGFTRRAESSVVPGQYTSPSSRGRGSPERSCSSASRRATTRRPTRRRKSLHGCTPSMRRPAR